MLPRQRAMAFGEPQMLGLLKRLIGKNDRADVVSKEAIDLIKRYQRFDEGQRREMMSAFEHAKARLEIENGAIHTWAQQCKALVAERTLLMAKDAYEYAPCGSCGVALVGLYLEAHSLPAEKAKRLVSLIEEWHRRHSP
jgi:hypothetical protein